MLFTSVTKGNCRRKTVEQMKRVNISFLLGARNSFGNRSQTEVITVSTETNLRQEKKSLSWILLAQEAVKQSYMCVNSEQNQHQEEGDSPELW